jgi:hypothetical protein
MKEAPLASSSWKCRIGSEMNQKGTSVLTPIGGNLNDL